MGRKATASPPVPKDETSSSDRSTSPLNPIRHSRLVEKVEMQNLNDRLAGYIENTRFLENENARLNALVQTSTEAGRCEIANIKTIYEGEVIAARKLADEIALEKAKSEIRATSLWEENEGLKQALKAKCKEIQISEGAAHLYELKYNESSKSCNKAVAECKKAIVEAKRLEAELVKLRKQVDDYRKISGKEVEARIDLENKVRSLRDEIKFKDQVHMKELNESRANRQVGLTENNSRLAEQYKAKLQESLQELRDQYEDQMRSNRDEIETLFDTKIKNDLTTGQRDNKVALEYLCLSFSRKEEINARIGELEQINSSANARIRDLQLMLNGERARATESETEVNRLSEEMAAQLERYQDLMDIKVSLDLEIAAYDKLLDGEEQRLNIKPSNAASVSALSRSFSRTVRGLPATKRIRSETFGAHDLVVTSSSTGNVAIAEVDRAGKFVKLQNKSANEIALGGWQLIRKADASETVHKFHHSVKVAGGVDLIVWSAESGVFASPGNIIMEAQSWSVANEMKTTLVDGDGNIEATTEQMRQSTNGTRKNADAAEKCSIM